MKEKTTPTQKALNVWAVILIIWAVYRAKLQLPEWFDEFIAKPLVFILPVFYYVTHFEKKEFFSAIKLHGKKADFLLGIGAGAIFFLSALLARQMLGKGIDVQFGGQSLILAVTLAFATAISEEILSRGFVLQRLYDESKNPYSSSFFASILFFFLHVPILFTNPNLNGNMLLVFMATDMILSLINSFIYLERKSLVLPIFIHAFYNISILFYI